MKCDEINIHCFFTELEKIKSKVDGNEDKIDWIQLTRELPIREEILDFYKGRIEWGEMKNLLWINNPELFKKYYDGGMYSDLSNLGTNGKYENIVAYLDKLDKQNINVFNINGGHIAEFFGLMIDSKKWSTDELIGMGLKSYNLNDVLNERFSVEDIIRVFLEIIDFDKDKSAPYLDNWMNVPALMAVIDLNKDSHRRFVLTNSSSRVFVEHFESKHEFTYKSIYNRFAPRLKSFPKIRYFFGLNIVKANK